MPSNSINKAPPFLELSKDTLQTFDTSGLDLENVLSVWTGLTKCSSFIKSGKRLENISWRIVNRNLINQNNQKIQETRNQNQNQTQRPQQHQRIPSGGSSTSNSDREPREPRESNKLNDGDFLSLLSIVADQNILPTVRPQLIRKKSSNQKLLRNSSRNSNKSVESFELQKNRPGLLPKKSSSSKSLKKLNQKRRSNTDLPNSTFSNTSNTSSNSSEQQQQQQQQQRQQQRQQIKVEHDSDLFEQPNPKYAFGVYNQPLLTRSSSNVDDVSSNESQKFQAPPLRRSDTSTSIVRGFSPNHISVAQFSSSSSSPNMITSNQTVSRKEKEKEKEKEQHLPPHVHQTSAPTSLFDQSNIKNPQPRKAIPSKSSLFTHQHHPQQLHHVRNESQQTSPLERVRSPLSQETTQEVLKAKEPSPQKQSNTSTLFQHSQPLKQPQHHQQQQQQSNIRPKSKTGTLFDHAALQDNHSSKSPLFEQVGISPDIKKRQPIPPPPPAPPLPQHHKKRNNVLNNLGMTSLAAKQHQPPRKDKNNMFFIESSPSPTEPSKLIDSHHRHNRQRSSSSEGTRDDSTSSRNRSSQLSIDEVESNENHEEGEVGHENNTSLFSGKSKPVPKEIIFSSDDSLSDESDWSSVSDSEGSEEFDENDLTKEWKQATSKRDEPLPKPQVKRSLLSGLFLNEMNETASLSTNNNSSNISQNHSRSTSGITTPQNWKPPSTTTNNVTIDYINRNGNANVGGGSQELGSSISSTNIHVVKHRNRPQSIHGNNNGSVGSSTVDDIHNNNNSQNSNNQVGYNTNNNSTLELSTTEPHTVISTSNINVSGKVTDPQETNDQSKLREKLTGTQQAATDANTTSTSFSQMISKSALNLTNYFASHRKNSFSSIASDRTKTRYKHESNAPPTASTLLPTALSTHMFLPNAHQRRMKPKLTSVIETDSGNVSTENSRKNSEVENNEDGNIIKRDNDTKSDSVVPQNQNVEKIELPTKSPTVPILTKKPSSNIEIEGLTTTETENPNFNISRKLSPKTTRRQMLATELSDSLRKSILWDRKHGLPNKHHNPNHHQQHKKNQETKVIKDGTTTPGEVTQSIENGEEKIELIKEDTGNPDQPKVIKSKIENFNNDWDTSETDFYTRGW